MVKKQPIMKPDITFYHEPLSDSFHGPPMNKMKDKEKLEEAPRAGETKVWEGG
jgi:hypothetical protein